jgi:cytochrome c
MYRLLIIFILLLSFDAITETISPSKLSNIGSPVTDNNLKKWDISIFFDGENLPKGSGTLEEGEQIWQVQCAMCHGDFGEGVKGYPKMLGDSMEDFKQVAQDGGNNVSIRGINNMWGHAPTLYDFIRRAMPFFAPQSLSNEQTYSVTGYVLMLAEVIEDNVEKIDAALLKSIKMPSVDNFYTDNRPDIKNIRCMKDCYQQKPIIVNESEGSNNDTKKESE